MTSPKVVIACCFMLVAAALTGCSQFVHCVAEGSLVATPDGDRPIETIHSGDVVWTQNADGKHEPGRVNRVASHVITHTLTLTFTNGRTLTVSPSQPLLINGAWMQAADAAPGNPVATSADATIVNGVQRLDQPTRVFDLTIEPNGNYFANGILAHNKSFAPRPTPESIAGRWIGDGGLHAWYYLELHPDGTGHAARFCRGYEDNVLVLLFDSWKLNGYEITIMTRSVAWHTLNMCFRGHAGPQHLSTTLIQNGAESGKVEFIRAENMRSMLDAFEKHICDEPHTELPSRQPRVQPPGLN